MSFLWHGLTDQGSQVPIQVDALGRVIAVDGTPGGSKWTRIGTTLRPSIPGDSVDVGSGNLTTLGRLLVGTSSTSVQCSVFAKDNSGRSGPGIIRVHSSVDTPVNGATLGLVAFGANNDDPTAWMFGARDGGTWTAGSSHPTRLVFATTPNGLSGPTERMSIKANGTINFSSVATYADNTAAKAGGLVNGDVYRTATGQLMIVFS